MKIRQKTQNDRKRSKKPRGRVEIEIGCDDPTEPLIVKPEAGVSGGQRREWPIIDGMARCAAITHAPYEILRMLAKSGCKAFLRAGRIDTEIIIPAAFDAILNNDQLLPAGCASWRDAGDKFRALNEKLDYEMNEKLLIPIAEVERQANAAGIIFMSGFERAARELPPMLAGLSTAEVAKHLDNYIERVRNETKEALTKIVK